MGGDEIARMIDAFFLANKPLLLTCYSRAGGYCLTDGYAADKAVLVIESIGELGVMHAGWNCWALVATSFSKKTWLFFQRVSGQGRSGPHSLSKVDTLRRFDAVLNLTRFTAVVID